SPLHRAWMSWVCSGSIDWNAWHVLGAASVSSRARKRRSPTVISTFMRPQKSRRRRSSAAALERLPSGPRSGHAGWAGGASTHHVEGVVEDAGQNKADDKGEVPKLRIGLGNYSEIERIVREQPDRNHQADRHRGSSLPALVLGVV